ncbi:U-box domain-containing protein 54 [Raphanus sativus]|uniref:RING-type E3 ubiquitin transferase n=1 Tax=Raphanus sativus TaxID=3726 RepID=A0A6J0NEQ1_RAPSA|nr:U-box domain-containing protein 54 [Raphanus sativus]KAJ4914604.1 U-box domain-containing protein 54 [Raphanus sativus]
MGETLPNDVIYVAVNQDVRESKSTLLWALKTLPVKKLCLLHVHIPFSLNSSSCGLDESEIDAIQESELKSSYDSLHKYRDLCTNKGVDEEDVDISLISGYGVGEGIVELIYQNNIKKLVMGAAADPHYSRGMSITSRKAEYVSQYAPHCCKMWFICKGKLIKTREGRFDIGNPSDSYSLSEFDGFAQKPSKGRGRDDDETDSHKEQHPGGIETPKKVRKEDDMTKSNDSETESPPEDFLCPISMEIMRDPNVAADGFTYEEKEIRTWLNGGNDKSPITGARLAHRHLTPNYTLRSLIKDWLHHHPNYKH